MSTGDRFDKRASDIVQRSRGAAQVAAARAWCDQFAPHFPHMAIDGWPLLKRAPDVVEVIHIATLEEPILGKMFVDLAAPPQPGQLPSVDAHIPLMVLWPIRESPEKYPAALAAWARDRGGMDHSCTGRPYLAARSLRGWPALAYAILEGLEAERLWACAGCRLSGPACLHRWRTNIALTRVVERLDPHPLDEDALQAITAGDLLGDEAVRPIACQLVSVGALPARLLDAVREAATKGNPLERVQAVRLLLASRTDQEDAVRLLASWFMERDVAVEYFANNDILHAACTGAGWGREHHNLARKLLPFTASQWRWENPMHANPMYLLRCLFSRSDEDGAWERVRECVAEHLLETAVNAPTAERMAALDAFEALQPGGDGSAVRALRRVQGDEAVVARARAVQTALAARLRDRTRLTDSELAIDDAWKAYWSSLKGREEP